MEDKSETTIESQVQQLKRRQDWRLDAPSRATGEVEGVVQEVHALRRGRSLVAILWIWASSQPAVLSVGVVCREIVGICGSGGGRAVVTRK